MESEVETTSYLSTGTVARRLGLSRHTVHRAVRDGALTPVQRTPGGYLRFTPDAVATYARALALAGPSTVREDESDPFFALAQDPMCVAGADGYFKRVNPAFSATLGWTADELLARPYQDFVHPDDRAATASEATQVGDGTPTPRFENRFQHKDGSWRWLSWRATTGAADGLLYAVARDVTDRGRAEDVFSVSEERFRFLLAHAPVGAAVADQNGIFEFVNDAYAAFYSYTAAEMVGQPVTMLVEPARRAALAAAYADYVARGIAAQDEYSVLTRTGERRTVLSQSVQYLGHDGRPRRATFSIDISARAHLEEALRASEARLRMVISNAPVVVYALDTAGIFTLSDGHALQDIGVAPGALVGRSILDVYHDDPEVLARIRRALAGQPSSFVSRAGGHVFTNQLVPLRDEQERVSGALGVATNVTERERAEEGRSQSEQRFRLAFTEAPTGMALATPDGRLLEVNQALCRMLGYTAEELIDQRSPVLTHPDDQAASRELLRQLLAAEVHSTRLEKRYLHKQGQVIWTDYTASLLRAADGRPLYFIFQMQDITARKAAEERLDQLHQKLYAQARHDPLTGLPNRVLFQDRIAQTLRSAKRTRDPVSLLLIDLDGFKAVNDTLGHAAGDRLLQEVGRRMQQVVRASDTVARLGGDEFVLLLPSTGRSGAIDVAAKVRAAVHAPISLNGQRVTVEGSIGIALYPTDGQDTATLLRQADAAMHAAKREGQGYALADTGSSPP